MLATPALTDAAALVARSLTATDFAAFFFAAFLFAVFFFAVLAALAVLFTFRVAFLGAFLLICPSQADGRAGLWSSRCVDASDHCCSERYSGTAECPRARVIGVFARDTRRSSRAYNPETRIASTRWHTASVANGSPVAYA